MPWVASTNNKGAFTGGNRARHFVTEVNVPGGVDHVKHVVRSIRMVIIHLDGVTLDGNTAFPLEIHIIELLVHFLSFTYGLRVIKQSVREGTLTVVNVGNNAEIADVLHGGC